MTKPTNHNPNDSALMDALDALGQDIRDSRSPDLESRVDRAVASHLDGMAPRALALPNASRRPSTVRWAAGLAIAAALAISAGVFWPGAPSSTSTTQPGPVAVNPAPAPSAAELVQDDADQGDLDDWFAAMNLTDDSDFDAVLSGPSEEAFWAVDDVLDDDDSVF